MAPRASAIEEQGLSEAVAARIEAPQRGSIRSVYEASGPFLQSDVSFIRWTSGHPLLSQLLTSLCTCFRTGSCSPAPLMVTGQPLLIDWEIRPSISVRMKISLVSWIVSTETDPKAGGESPPGTSPLFFAPADKVHFEPIKEASLKHLTFKTVFLLALGSGKRRSETHAWQNRNIRHQSDWARSPCTHHPAFSPRISWPKRVQTVWPQGL